MSESNIIKINDHVEAMRPPDGDWEFWFRNGEEHPMPALPGVVPSGVVENLGKAVISVPDGAEALALMVECAYSRGRAAGRADLRSEIQSVARLFVEPFRKND